MENVLEQIRRRDDVVFVPMNEAQSCRWSPTQQYLATEGLNSCTAVAIYSKYAGVLAHIAPRTETATGAENLQILLQRVIYFYNVGRQRNLFPPATSIVLAAVYQGEVALPDAIDTIKRVLERLGIPITYREYRVRQQGQLRARGETSIVIRGIAGQDPEIYVNNQLLDTERSTVSEPEEDPNVQRREKSEEEGKENDDEEAEETGENSNEANAEMDDARRVLAMHIQQARNRRDQLINSGYTPDQAVIALVPVLQESLNIPRDQAVSLLETGLINPR